MYKNKYNIIGISGKKGSGKDTFFKLFNKHSPYIYENSKFSDKLREIASSITGYSINYFYDRNMYDTYLEDWDMNIREILQKLGLEAMREGFDYDVWIKTFFANYHEENNYMITDVRFPNEIEAIQKHGGIVIRLDGRGDDDGDKHFSESALDGFDGYDYVVNNNGSIKDYENEVIKLIDSLFTNKDFLEYPVTLRKVPVGHYSKAPGWIEPIEVVVNSNMNFCQGNYVKYISRHENKGRAIGDLNKALDYLFWSIETNDDSIVAKNSEGKPRKVFFDKFIEQHTTTTIELLREFLMFENKCSHEDINWKENIEPFYQKINEYAIENFGEELTTNVFYDSINKEVS